VALAVNPFLEELVIVNAALMALACSWLTLFGFANYFSAGSLMRRFY